MASALILRSRSTSDHLLPPLLQLPHLLILTRSMGGGPRTFPGGLTKWQYRREHEKMARQRAQRLLRSEKQLYLSRLRAGERSDPQPESVSRASKNYYMSSKEHFKALAVADKFTLPGAEDLWNEDDGPVTDRPKKPLKNSARIPKLSTGLSVQKRGYSTRRKWRVNSSSEEESGNESELETESESVRSLRRNPFFSSAGLGENNLKKESSLNGLGRERGSRSSEIQEIRDEFRSRKVIAKMEERMMEPKGEPDFTNKRFYLTSTSLKLDSGKNMSFKIKYLLTILQWLMNLAYMSLFLISPAYLFYFS